MRLYNVRIVSSSSYKTARIQPNLAPMKPIRRKVYTLNTCCMQLKMPAYRKRSTQVTTGVAFAEDLYLITKALPLYTRACQLFHRTTVDFVRACSHAPLRVHVKRSNAGRSSRLAVLCSSLYYALLSEAVATRVQETQ